MHCVPKQNKNTKNAWKKWENYTQQISAGSQACSLEGGVNRDKLKREGTVPGRHRSEVPEGRLLHCGQASSQSQAFPPHFPARPPSPIIISLNKWLLHSISPSRRARYLHSLRNAETNAYSPTLIPNKPGSPWTGGK